MQAGSLTKAVNYIDEFMGKTMIDYAIASVAETQIMDVFEHDASADSHKQQDDQSQEA